MSEFIGSRISLVSKSDIRYVGTLTEINSESSTVALENVQSFGTEGRKQNPDEELGPSDTVFEYIVFRGSDVKDLRIEEPPKENKPPQSQVPNDPAILGSGSRPGHAGSSERSANDHRPQHPQFPQPQQYSYPPQHRPFPPHHGFGGFSGGFPGQYGPPPGWFPQPGRPFSEHPPDNFSPHGQHSMMFGGPQFPNQPRSSGSELERQFRPPPQEVPGVSATYQKPSPADAPDARPEVLLGPTNNTDGPRQSVSDDQPLQARSQRGGPASKPSNPQGTDDDANIMSQRNRPTKVVPALPKQTIARKAHPPAQPVAGSTSAGGQVAATAALQYQNATQAATAAVAAAMAKLPQLPTQKTTVQAEDKKVDVLAKQVSEMKTEDRTRNSRPPLPGTHGGLNRGRGARRGPRGGGKGIDVPSSDFDFESANAQFSKEDLVKEAIATGSPLDETSTPAEPTGESAPDRATDSSEVVIPPALVYQRSSFFDNISSEAKEREDAGDNRRRGPELRIEERRRNYETFGLGSVDGGHRGGYRGRNRGRGMRGGSMRGREGPRHRGRGFALSADG